MAEFLYHSNRLRRLIKRWKMSPQLRSGEAQISEATSWLQPSLLVDRDWADDDRVLWGVTADYTPAAGQFPAVAIFAGSKEVLLRRIDWKVFTPVVGMEVNVLTPPTGYNPVVFNPGQFYPFLQSNRANPDGGSTIGLPEAIIVSGHQTGLMQVTINGVLINPAIGPRYVCDTQYYGSAVQANCRNQVILDWDNPPWLLPAWRVLAVQVVNPVANRILYVNYYFSEREVE
jgi:hypothetical protein